MSGQYSKDAKKNSWNKEEIKFSKNKDEDANRKKYQKKEEIHRKWLKIHGKLNEHGYLALYESVIKEAFNLTEFVMTNYLETFFDQRKNLPDTKHIRDRVYTYEGYEQPIDWGLLDKGFAGKTELLEKVKINLPKGIDKVRKLRNTMIHGTESYVAIDTELLKDYAWVEEKVRILGELLIAMRKMPQTILTPDYQAVKAGVGDVIGYNNDFTLLEILREDGRERIFRSRESESGRDVTVTELVTEGKMPSEDYRKFAESLCSVRGNGIARTISVIYENKTVYIVRERVEGKPLDRYLADQNPDDEQKRDLRYQLRSIFKTLDKYPKITAGLRKEDLLVDDDGMVWLVGYVLGGSTENQKALLAGYETILSVPEKEQESVAPEQEIKPSIENDCEEVPEVSEEILQPREPEKEPEKETVISDVQEVAFVQDTPATEPEEIAPNWMKLWVTLGSCACVILLFWAIAGLIG